MNNFVDELDDLREELKDLNEEELLEEKKEMREEFVLQLKPSYVGFGTDKEKAIESMNFIMEELRQLGLITEDYKIDIQVVALNKKDGVITGDHVVEHHEYSNRTEW